MLKRILKITFITTFILTQSLQSFALEKTATVEFNKSNEINKIFDDLNFELYSEEIDPLIPAQRAGDKIKELKLTPADFSEFIDSKFTPSEASKFYAEMQEIEFLVKSNQELSHEELAQSVESAFNRLEMSGLSWGFKVSQDTQAIVGFALIVIAMFSAMGVLFAALDDSGDGIYEHEKSLETIDQRKIDDRAQLEENLSSDTIVLTALRSAAASATGMDKGQLEIEIAKLVISVDSYQTQLNGLDQKYDEERSYHVGEIARIQPIDDKIIRQQKNRAKFAVGSLVSLVVWGLVTDIK